jgi:HPr kinase/phosphorylase
MSNKKYNKYTTISDIVDKFNLKVISGKSGLSKILTNNHLNMGRLELAGYFEFLDATRIMILGTPELSFLRNLSRDVRRLRLTQLLFYPIPAIILTDGNTPKKDFIDITDKFGIPLLATAECKDKFVLLLSRFLSSSSSPARTMHGVLVEIYGVGVLLQGNSGIGKSECALELIHRGHRLVVDDVVFITRTEDGKLIGRADSLLKHHMEIRGLGIINIKELYGIGAISDFKEIELILVLEKAVPDKIYDRLGIETNYTEILDVNIPTVCIPVMHGKNISVIAEVAAMNHHLKQHGQNAATRFIDKLTERMNKNINPKII